MKELKFETGVQSYAVNGVKNAFTANLTEGGFIDRLCNAMESLQKMHRELSIKENADISEMLTLISDYDKNVRAAIDGAFGDGTSEKVFGNQSTFSFGEHSPVWVNFLVSVMEEADNQFSEETKTVNPKLKKFLNKYAK